MKKEVVIITGNPKFIEGNQLAKDFYNEIKNFCEEFDVNVSFDPGSPHTIPKPAYLWIGHSRGCDRLKFAPKGIKILALGSSNKEALNDPQDNTKDLYGENETIPNSYHYSLLTK